MHNSTLYTRLEVNQIASAEVIEASYHSLAKRWNPDNHPTNRKHAEQNLKQIKQTSAQKVICTLGEDS